MIAYVDSSFMVSIYVRSVHSAKADALITGHSHLPLTPFLLAEWAHAIAAQVFRGQMSVTEAARVEKLFAEDRQGGLWADTPMPDQAFEVCAQLARRHGPKLGVRTLDSLHVACALELKADHFWTFDERQAKLAKAQGLRIS